MIKKIWNDPVWSKIIAAAMIGVFTIVYAKITSLTLKITFSESLKKILYLKIEIFYLIGVFSLLFILWLAVRMIKGSHKIIITEEDSDELEINYSDEGILIKCKVEINNGTSSVMDLTFFCTKHGEIPRKFLRDKCPVYDCANSKVIYNKELIINEIESIVIHKLSKGIKNGKIKFKKRI